ncbi:hypothetical protein GG344DRAFT_90386 [Lentinula edodes]|nr:hypothetical protein GG344DRAFT_90386 [Lentinula edodes]
MSAQTALLIGASGQTGQHLLKELLNSPKFSQVFEYGRRVTDLESISHGKEKLQQKVIDFEKLSESGLKDGQWDVVFITLGTTRKNAGSADSFEKIDREYVINSAREARTDGKDQRLVYLSSAGADASSSFLYTKSKGLTELGLASLGYKETIVFRPAVLAGVSRPESRPFETFGRYVTSVLSHVTSSVEIKVGTLAKAMAKAGSLGSASLPAIAHATQEGKEGALFTVIRNSGAIALADSEL